MLHLIYMIKNFNYVIFVLFVVMYSYQMIYLCVALYSKNKKEKEKVITCNNLHKYAVLIAARNEEKVIGELIKSIKNQRYPSELIDIYVVADNCTDNTAAVARNQGAVVYERSNLKLVGKGYALDFLLKKIFLHHSDEKYEGYFVFDADNLLDENFVAEMNKLFDQGYRVLTSYRNSKNFGTNWITAGYSLWFLRESQYLNYPRMLLNTSCAISGTGFLICDDIIRKNGGWMHHLLTEDIEFSIDSIIHGEQIGYCGKAKLYDEQPVSFRQSWKQRLRWAKGFYQVFAKYGNQLVKTIFKEGKCQFASYDMLMAIMPAMLLSLSTLITNSAFMIYVLLHYHHIFAAYFISKSLWLIFYSFFGFYGSLYAVGLLTTITEWKNIHCSSIKKILYTFTFPIFMFTYIPIAIVALFKKVEWYPITHNVVKTLEEVR